MPGCKPLLDLPNKMLAEPSYRLGREGHRPNGPGRLGRTGSRSSLDVSGGGGGRWPGAYSRRPCRASPRPRKSSAVTLVAAGRCAGTECAAFAEPRAHGDGRAVLARRGLSSSRDGAARPRRIARPCSVSPRGSGPPPRNENSGANRPRHPWAPGRSRDDSMARSRRRSECISSCRQDATVSLGWPSPVVPIGTSPIRSRGAVRSSRCSCPPGAMGRKSSCVCFRAPRAPNTALG